MINNKMLFCICLLAGCMTMACGTQKKVVEPTATLHNYSSGFSPEAYFKAIADNSSSEKWLSAKIKCTIAMDDQDISTHGQLRMKKDEVIQILLFDPWGVLELGRLEFSKTNLKMLDRFHKKYIDVPYEEVDFLKKSNVDFNCLQNLFWNKLFIPSKPIPSAEDFDYSDEQGGEPSMAKKVVMKYADQLLTYEFTTNPINNTLEKTMIYGTKDVDSQFLFTYSDFQKFQGTNFPHDMCMSFIMGKQHASIQFTMNSVKNKSGWDTNTSVPSKYTKMDPEELFKSLIGK